jgi:hypothetical protein
MVEIYDTAVTANYLSEIIFIKLDIISNKCIDEKKIKSTMVGMVGRTSQLACQRSPHVGPT